MSSNRRKSMAAPGKDQTCRRMEQMEAEREERRRLALERKKARALEEQRNIAAGNPGDVDFIGMVRQWRQEHAQTKKPHDSTTHPRICICVRKRPISDKERAKLDHDSVTCLNPVVWIHRAKFKVDGITKYLDHQSFRFDHAFDETVDTDDIYRYTTMPLLDFCMSGIGGRATVFAYGQTGSGKTHTMQGIQQMLADDLFLLLEGSSAVGCNNENTTVMISFFELYGGCIQDLLNDRQRLKVLEDGKGEINVTGLKEMEVTSPEEFLDLVQIGNLERTTHTTEANDTSSRSHAICQIMLRDRSSGKLRGKLSLVDLAGSERGTDTKSHNAQRRTESAEINTSLLALKECIRALADKKSHVPYRASKLTLLLKDCFTCESAMTTMIATISPGASAADHSLNTLRYADRTKDKSGKKSPMRPSCRETSITRNEPSEAKTKAVVMGGDEVISNRERSSQDEVIRKSFAEFFEQEENTLNAHIDKIRIFAELLEEEGALLSQIQNTNRSAADVDEYATALEDILNKKELMITHLRDQISLYKDSLRKQQELSKATKRSK